MDLLGFAALGAVSAEWLVLGWLSGIDWPAAAADWWAPRWALRLLVGATLVAFTQALVALTPLGFGNPGLVLALTGSIAGGLRLAVRSARTRRTRFRPAWLARAAVDVSAAATAAAPGEASPAPRVTPAAREDAPAGRPSGSLSGSPARAQGRPAVLAAELAAVADPSAPGLARGSAPGGHQPGGWAAMQPSERIGWLLLGGVLLAATLRALVVPETGWDAYSHWGLRAQAYALAGTVVSANSEHEYYPPLVPLLEAWLALHRGAVSIDLNKTVWAVVGAAYGMCLGWHLRLALGRAWVAPLIATGIVLATPALIEGFWTGQADLALTAYLSLTALTLAAWVRARRPAWLSQAVVFGGAAALTKLEGGPSIGVIVLALVLLALTSPRSARTSSWLALTPWRVDLIRASGLLVATALAASLVWVGVAAHAGISPNAEHFGHFQPFAIGSVLVSLVAVFGGLRTGGGLLVAALLWLIAGRQLLRDPALRLLTLVVLGSAAGTLLGFLISDAAPSVEVRTSATRLVEHWLPLALFAGAVAVGGPSPPAVELERAPGNGGGTYNRRGR